jgi:hypothetical protein
MKYLVNECLSSLYLEQGGMLVKNLVDVSCIICVRNNRCAHFTIDNIAILAPNHRPKPPLITLTLIERIISEANLRSNIQSR